MNYSFSISFDYFVVVGKFACVPYCKFGFVPNCTDLYQTVEIGNIFTIFRNSDG